MVVGIPSSVTIIEEEDIHVCELPPNSTSTSVNAADPTTNTI